MSQQHAQSLALQLRDVFGSIRSSTTPDQRPMHQVWRETLNVPEGDTALYEAIRLLGTTFDRLNQQITDCRRLSEGSRKVYQPALKAMQTCFAPQHLHNSCQEMQRYFAPERLDLLTTLSDALVGEFPEPALTETDIEEIRRALKELDDLVECDLPPVLKSFLVSQINVMRWALENVTLVGIDALHDMLARSMLAFNRHQEVVEGASKKPGTWKRVVEGFERINSALARADKLVSYGRTAVRLYRDLTPLLPGGGGGGS